MLHGICKYAVAVFIRWGNLFVCFFCNFCIFSVLLLFWFFHIVFSPPAPGKHYPTLRALLKVSKMFIDNPEIIVDIIKARAPEFPQQTHHSGLLLTYLIGDLLVILADGKFIVKYTPYETPTATPTMTDPMTFGSIFTSYHYQTPTSTPGMTDWPISRSTRIIIYSKYIS